MGSQFSSNSNTINVNKVHITTNVNDGKDTNTSTSNTISKKKLNNRRESFGQTFRRMLGGSLPPDEDDDELTEDLHSENNDKLSTGNNIDIFEKMTKKQELMEDWSNYKLKKIVSFANMNPIETITLSVLSKHNKDNDCWIAYNGQVYDVTEYLNFHPGGLKRILKGGGTDCTTLFDKYHDWVDCDAILSNYHVGVLII